jgi:4-alpha-glucanotransferase
MTSLPRQSGILLHPTSLPGPHGSGDLGPAAYHFVDWLVAAGQSLWQVLPLGSVGPGNSPYISPSAFAGNELLIDLSQLRDAGWLTDVDLASVPAFPEIRVDYASVRDFRVARLRRAAKRFFGRKNAPEHSAFAAFCSCSQWTGSTTTPCSWRSTSPMAAAAGCGRTGPRRWRSASPKR